MSLPDYTQPQYGPRGRLLLLLPGLPLVVTHERIRNQVIHLKRPRDLRAVWSRLPQAVRIDLTHDGLTEASFTDALVRDYQRILRREYRRAQGDLA